MNVIEACNKAFANEHVSLDLLYYIFSNFDEDLYSNLDIETFGIRIKCLNTHEEVCIPNITCSFTKIKELAETVTRNLVTPIAFRDVVQDWLLI